MYSLTRYVAGAFAAVTLMQLCAISARAQGVASRDDDTSPAPRFLLASAATMVRARRVDVERSPSLMQRIAVDLDGVSLRAALDTIASRAGMRLAYDTDIVPAAAVVHLRAQSITVAAALTDLLTGAELDVVFNASGGAALVRRVPEPQPGSIEGRVTDARAGIAIAGASLQLEGTRFGTATDNDGRYRISGVAAGTYVVIVRRIGYSASTKRVTVSDGATATLDFALGATATTLDQIVVTGTAGGEQKRVLGNAITSLDAAPAREMSGANDVTKLLNGRVSGLTVLQGSGRVGAGAEVTIRGRSTLSLTAQPIVYIDGIRVANDLGTGPSSQGSQVVSRLNDINPDDIASIEVIKGPAAATLYGTEASNGVLQIITKRGSAGKAKWNLSLQQGTAWFMNAQNRLGLDYARDPKTGAVLTFDPVVAAKASGTPLFQNGHTQDYQLSVSGGEKAVQYYVAGGLQDDHGIDPLNKFRRYGGHANLLLHPGSNIDITSSVNLLSSDANLGMDNGNSPMFSAMFGNPLLLNTPKHGFFFAPPAVYYSGIFQNTQAVDRYTSSVAIDHRAATWFRQHLVVGLDQTTENNISLTNYMSPAAAQFFPSSAQGSINDTERALTLQTADYSGSATFALGAGASLRNSVGGQFYRRETRTVVAAGRNFPGPGVSTVAATAVPTVTASDVITNTTVGFYEEEQLGWRDRLFVTGAVRVDNNSAFGRDFKWVTYPKLGLSWVASEEPFFHVPFVSALKLRAAYGASGQQPGVFTALRTYTATAGPNDVSAVTPSQIGNPNLKPERGEELEAGFDASILANRVGVEFTYFDKAVRDAILLRQNAPSFGFPGSQYVNIGRVQNSGLEVEIKGKAVDRRDVGLDVTLSAGTARNVVKDLGSLPFVSVYSIVGQQDVVGYPIGSFFLKRVVSAQLDASGKAINVLCDGGPQNNGTPTPCAQAPSVYLGQPTPTVTGSTTATLRLRNWLHLYGMVDFQRGFKIFDWDRNIRCVQIPNCEADVSPEKYDPRYVAEIQNGNGFVIASRFVSDAAFAKLRELSATVDLPAAIAKRAGAGGAALTITARNLHTWTKFTGLDPEFRTPVFSVSEVVSLQQATIPPLAELGLALRLSF